MNNNLQAAMPMEEKTQQKQNLEKLASAFYLTDQCSFGFQQQINSKLKLNLHLPAHTFQQHGITDIFQQPLQKFSEKK